MRAIGYAWASPNTLLGLLFAPLALVSDGGFQFKRGAVEIHGGFAKWFLRKACGGVSAMTLGHVILGVDRAALDRCRDHEHIHVAQYMRWGFLFLPAYGLSSLLCLLRGKNPYLHNRFEIEAYDKFPI
jgi:hypothetical protein